MKLMDLNEQADRDFGRARRRSWLRRAVARIRKEPASHYTLLSFDDLRKSLRAHGGVCLGMKVVDVDKIVGSVGRPWDFDRFFMPLRASAGKKWKRVDLAFHRGEDLPPVSLYRLGEAYFVLDGNFRVSVARYHDLPAVEADVTEFLPAAAPEARAA